MSTLAKRVWPIKCVISLLGGTLRST
jgi:hypothetical protein